MPNPRMHTIHRSRNAPCPPAGLIPKPGSASNDWMENNALHDDPPFFLFFARARRRWRDKTKNPSRTKVHEVDDWCFADGLCGETHKELLRGGGRSASDSKRFATKGRRCGYVAWLALHSVAYVRVVSRIQWTVVVSYADMMSDVVSYRCRKGRSLGE